MTSAEHGAISAWRWEPAVWIPVWQGWCPADVRTPVQESGKV